MKNGTECVVFLFYMRVESLKNLRGILLVTGLSTGSRRRFRPRDRETAGGEDTVRQEGRPAGPRLDRLRTMKEQGHDPGKEKTR